MFSEEIKQLFLSKFGSSGSDSFYDFLITYGTQRIDNFSENELSPEREFMNLYFSFLDLYRLENNETYLEIAKQFRKAAHAIYRIMLRSDLIEKNNGFLNLVVNNERN